MPLVRICHSAQTTVTDFPEPTIAFEPVIRTQGSPELKQKYADLIAHRGIMG